MANYIGAIDQGTTSTRFIVFDRSGSVISAAQKEHEQIYPNPGWVEHNPEEIWQRTREVIAEAMTKGKLHPSDLAAIGITNQRETTVLWNRKTGKAVANALVWQDTRVADYVERTGKSGRAGSLSPQNRATAYYVFQRFENPLDSRTRERRPRDG